MLENDKDFKAELNKLDKATAQKVAVAFVENVLPLADDERIGKVLNGVKNFDLDPEELISIARVAKKIRLENHARCGADADWKEQTTYHVSKAAFYAISLNKENAGTNVYQAAVSSRMARVSNSIVNPEDTVNETREQYRILEQYLSS